MDTQGQPRENVFIEIIKFSLIALIIVVPIRFFIAQPFIVQGASMKPAFESGQYLIVDQLSYRFEAPERGEIIIFRHPDNPSTFLIKRIVGLPGETVTVRTNSTTITSNKHPEGMLLDEPYVLEGDSSSPQTITLKESEYFVMGDNRRASSDSRSWGPLEKDLIVGKAFLRLLPFDKIGVSPGGYNTQK